MKKKMTLVFLFISIFVVVLGFKNTSSSFTSKKVDYNGNELLVSIDGRESDTLPRTGNYYLVSYDCKSSDTKVSWDRTNYQLSVTNGRKKAGVSCYLDFQSTPKLRDVAVGSYVKYSGNNGCVGKACDGVNANYVNDNEMGYCSNSSHQFITNGWRVGYKDQESAYLISAGSPECVCTSGNGDAKASCNSVGSYGDLSSHLKNLDKIALRYCNQDYAYNGVCNVSSSWSLKEDDFKKITSSFGVGKNLLSCMNSNKDCGYGNDLIDIGGEYWFGTLFGNSSSTAFYWDASKRSIYQGYSYNNYGLRPVLKLHPSVIVIGGSGTYDDPYLIGNNTFLINHGAQYVSKGELSNVQLNLLRLPNVEKMCINVDSSGCSNYVAFSTKYSLDWTNIGDGKKNVYVYYKDASDQIVASMMQNIVVDTVAPKKNSVRVEDGNGINRELTLSSSGASLMCFSNELINGEDCKNWVKYDKHYNWRLSDGIGEKVVYAFFKDEAGNISSSKSEVTMVRSLSDFYVVENFSSEDYDHHLIISGDWVIANGRLQSSNVGKKNSESSSMIKFTPLVDSVLSFDYGISSETLYDVLNIKLIDANGISQELVQSASGIDNGSISNIHLKKENTYTLVLSYQKDGSGDFGDDIGYIDRLKIES